jgi:predicted permease
MDTLKDDLRFALRSARGAPGATAVAVTALALGIGVCVSVFSVFDALSLRPLGFDRPAEIVRVEMPRFSYSQYLEIWDGMPSLSGLVAVDHRGATLRDSEGAALLLAEVVSPNYFTVLGVRPAMAAGGVPYSRGSYPTAAVWMVDHRYMQTMRMPLRAGRYFDERDSEQSPPALVISESMARRLWPSRDPIGHTARLGDGREHTVVGVVADVRHSLEESPQADVYLNMRQTNLWLTPVLVVRSRRLPASLVADVRAAMKAFDPAIASNEFTTLDEVVNRAVAPRRLSTMLLGSFSSFALLLAALGLYGVIAYSVSQRIREIGTRVAIGARPVDVLRLVVGEGLRLAGAGVALGLVAAFFAARLLESHLFGVAAHDPMTYATSAAVLGMVALLACGIPACRAANLDPIEALRCE